MNVRQKLSLAALCLTLPAMASAQAAPAPAAEPAAAPAAAPAPAIEVKPYGFALVTYNMMTGTFAYPEYPGKISGEKLGTVAADQVDAKTNSVSARQSRFGFAIKGADAGVLGAKLSGKFEADFFGGVTGTDGDAAPTALKATPGSWDSALLRLRYAYGQAVWAFPGAGNVTLTLGQTDGLVNPLHPELGAYIATPTFMFAGNLTRRSPQIRVGYDYDAGMVAAQVEVAALNAQDKGGAGINFSAGNYANMPDIEVRGQVVVKPMADIKGTLGVGYHTNKQTYNIGTANTQDLTSTVFGLDVNVEATKYLNVRGEFFSGKGSDEGQSGAFGDTTGTAPNLELLETTGYWVQAVVKPLPYLWVMGGMGQESAKDSADTKYSMLNVGVLSNVGKNLRLGLEYTSSKRAQNSTGSDLSGSAIALSSRFSF